jgi:pimeloyl-ACP methyl ester carboxylesterase
VEKQGFNRRAFVLAPTVLRKIPVGEVPEPKGVKELGWLDWDGRLVEFQPYGGRMIIFMGGYGGSSFSQSEAFRWIKEKLVEKGWRRTQFLEATYKIDINALPRGEIKPQDYQPEDTKLDPMLSVSKLRLELRRYKELLPLTKFILIGHSLGGFIAFEAALAHTDAVEAVITLDSPLKGVDRSFWSESVDKIIIDFMGKEVGEYLVKIGDDPATAEIVENKAKKLRSQGVRVFTITNKDDIFIPSWVAVLENSDTEYEGEKIQLIWELGHEPFESFGVGELATGHGQTLEDPAVLELIAKIAAPRRG